MNKERPYLDETEKEIDFQFRHCGTDVNFLYLISKILLHILSELMEMNNK